MSRNSEGRSSEQQVAKDDPGLTGKGQCTEVRPVGQGGFGRALLVKRKSDGALFIIKEVNMQYIERQKEGQKLADLAKQEASIMFGLRHPNIVRVYGAFYESNNFNLVMEYCEAGDLQHAINEQKGQHFPEPQICEWSAQLTLTLNYLHTQHHILHRDIKPSNVFLTANKRLIKLGDFGIAKVIAKTGQGGSTAVSTPTFSAPEFCKGKPYTVKSEAWALGVLIYNLAALDVPFHFDGHNLLALAMSITGDAPKALPNQYSAEMRDFVDKLMDKSEDKRLSIGDALSHKFLLLTITKWGAEVIGGGGTSHTSFRVEKQQTNDPPASASASLLDRGLTSNFRGADVKLDSASTLLAAENGDVALLRRIAATAKGRVFLESVQATDAAGDNLLHRASRHGQADVVEYLLEDDKVSCLFPPDAKNKKDDAAIHLAAARGYVVIITALAKAGANLNLLGARGDHFEVLPTLFASEDVKAYETTITEDGVRETAMHTACIFGHFNVVAALAKFGADVTFPNTSKSAPIHIAAGCGHGKSFVEFFLGKGVPVGILGRFGRTPLHYVAMTNAIDTAKLLLSRGAAINAKQDQQDGGFTPLHLAALWGKLDMVKFFLESGADMEAKTASGNTPLGKAASGNNFEIIDFLINKGANISAAKRPLFTVKGESDGRRAWHYVLVDIPKLQVFVTLTSSGTERIDAAEYGTIVESGWGEKPPEEVNERLKKEYPE